MPSQLEQSIATYRRLVLSADTQSLAAINAAYEQVLERLRPLAALLQTEINRMGDDAKPGDVFKLNRYQQLQAQLEDEIQRLARIQTAQTAAQQAEMVRLGVEAAQSLAVAQGGVQVASAWNRVPLSALEDLIGALSDGSPLADLFDKIAPDALAKGSKALTEGLALGKHPTIVADALDTALSIGKQRAMLISRTEMLRSYRTSSLRQYSENSDILDSWIWSASLSPTSCSACISLSGQHFPLSVMFFPSHPACRCAAIPSVKGVAAPAVPTGAEWLAKQDAKVQDAVLGSQSAGKAYRAGEVELRDFVQVRHDERWGTSYQPGSLIGALDRAERRAA